MNKRRVFSVSTVTVCLLAAVVSMSLLSYHSGGSLIALAADASGDDITYVTVSQYNGTDWNVVKNFTTTGGSERVHDNWQIRFLVGVKFNNTLVASVAEAETYTWIRMNITYNAGADYMWTNYNLTYVSYALDGDFYYGQYTADWNATTAATLCIAGTTYNCTVDAGFYY